MDIGSRLKILIRESGLSLPAFAQRAGISRTALLSYRDNHTSPQIAVLERICKEFRVRPEWLLLGRGPMREDEHQRAGDAGPSADSSRERGPAEAAESVHSDEFFYVPKVEAVLSAGHGSWLTDKAVIAYYAFRKDWIKTVGAPSHMVLMEVQGDSMHPAIQAGDHVLIDTSQTKPIQGRIMAVAVEDTIVIKRIGLRPGLICLISDNRAYDTIEIKTDDPSPGVRILGRLVWLARQLR